MTRVMIKQDATNIEMPAHVVLTLNWFDELQRLVPSP